MTITNTFRVEYYNGTGCPMNPDEWITTESGEVLVTDMKLIISERYGKEK